MLHQLIRLPLKFIPKGRAVPILSGPSRGLKWVTGSGTHGCWLGTYERDRQQRLVEVLKPGECFLDIGANVGFYSLLASRIVGASGQVHSFEPFPRNVEYLKKHIGLNNLQNVTAYAVALSDGTDRTMSFATSINPSSGHLQPDGHKSATHTPSILPSPRFGEKAADRPDEGFAVFTDSAHLAAPGLQVAVTSLDALWARNAFPKPAVIKIDVEGAEFSVLQGGREMLTECCPTILLAGHGTAVQEQCCELLRSWGYRLQIDRDGKIDGMYESTAWPDAGFRLLHK